jgi:hypothetical protein
VLTERGGINTQTASKIIQQRSTRELKNDLLDIFEVNSGANENTAGNFGVE